MKLLQSYLVVGILILVTSAISAQYLQITRYKKSVYFETGTLIRVDVPPKESLMCDPCPNNYVIGRIISYKNDTLTLHVFYESEPIMDAKHKIGYKVNYYEFKNEKSWPVFKIPKSNIYSITKQGENKWKPSNDGDLIGATFTILGLMGLSGALLARGETNSDNLVGVGLFFTGAGIIMITCFDRKTYHLENSPNLKDKEKTWNIR